MKLTYKIKTANEKEIRSHFNKCDEDFIIQLAEKVNLDEYSKKIFEKSITFETWENKNLVGLVASYFNDTENQLGYITNVSVTKKFQGKGIAAELMKMSINYAKENQFKEIKLEVDKDNIGAIGLYKKYNFENIGETDENLIMKLKINYE